MPSELSGGEAQRVAIARALANRPRIILADEPTAPLDLQRARFVMDLLRRIAVDQDAAIICVTHDETIMIGSITFSSCARPTRERSHCQQGVSFEDVERWYGGC